MAATETKVQYYLGTGRRKTSVARIRLADGTGKLLINGRPLEDHFREEKDREAVLAPLKVTELANKLDVWAEVHGGGFTGQAGAVCQGIARALKSMFSRTEPEPSADGTAPAVPPQIKKLRDSGLLTRDARMKERKKYGLRGARRGVQFSKR